MLDRLVQAVGEPVAMTFDPVTYAVLTPPPDLALFVAFTTHGAEPSDTLHRSLRRRYDGGDPAVTAAMRDLAREAERARHGIDTADLDLLGDAINRTWEIRASIVTVDDLQLRLVSIGRRLGAAVNSAGSGGSVVGLARSDAHREQVRAEYESDGFECCVIE